MFARTMGGIPSGVTLSHVMLCWHGSMDLHETADFHATTSMRAGLLAVTAAQAPASRECGFTEAACGFVG